MSAIVERARERVEEVRTRGVRTVLEERFPGKYEKEESWRV